MDGLEQRAGTEPNWVWLLIGAVLGLAALGVIAVVIAQV